MENEKFVKASDVKEYFKRAIFGADQKIDKWVDAIPSADVRPVVRGEWFDVGSLSCRCSVCGCKNDRVRNFCPNCGAVMKGAE